jgi:hypothetical protein
MTQEEIQYKATMTLLLKVVKEQATLETKKNRKRLAKTKTKQEIDEFYTAYRQNYLLPADQFWLQRQWDQGDQAYSGFVGQAENFFSMTHPAEKSERCSVYALNYLINSCASTKVKEKNIALIKANASACKGHYNINDLVGQPDQQREQEQMFCSMMHTYRVDMQLGFEMARTMSERELVDQMWEAHQIKTQQMPSASESIQKPKKKEKIGDRLLRSIF